MQAEITILVLGAVLLLVHIFAAAHFRTRQYGVDWNMGARDEPPPPLQAVAGRLFRAQSNFQETFPIAIIALLGVVIAGRADGVSALGGWIWICARIVYLPIYAAGIAKIRTLVFLISLAGLGMVFWTLVFT